MSLKFKLHSQTKNIILSLKGILYVLLLRFRRTFLEYLNRMMFVPILQSHCGSIYIGCEVIHEMSPTLAVPHLYYSRHGYIY